jgi:hypothetical protein
MTTSVSRRINILCLMFKIRAFFYYKFVRRVVWGLVFYSHVTKLLHEYIWSHDFPKSGGLIHFPKSEGLVHFPKSGGLVHFPKSGGLVHFPMSGGLVHFPKSGGSHKNTLIPQHFIAVPTFRLSTIFLLGFGNVPDEGYFRNVFTKFDIYVLYSDSVVFFFHAMLTVNRNLKL